MKINKDNTYTNNFVYRNPASTSTCNLKFWTNFCKPILYPLITWDTLFEWKRVEAFHKMFAFE